MNILRLLALSLMLVGGVAHAQESDAETPSRSWPKPSDRLQLTAPSREGRALRAAGIATTVVGSALTIIGVGLMVGDAHCVDGCRGSGSFEGFIAGIGTVVGGQVMTLVGIPIWAAGQKRINEAERTRIGASASGLRVVF